MKRAKYIYKLGITVSLSILISISGISLGNAVPKAPLWIAFEEIYRLETKNSPSAWSGLIIPEQYGSIESQHINNPEKLAILIKDAHCIYEVQKNISKILEILVRDYDVQTICTEGAAGQLDLTDYRNFPDKRKRDKVIDEFVKQGFLSGIELFGITAATKKDFQIKGVEDKNLYLENFISFYRVNSKQKESLNQLQQIQECLSQIKEKVYSESLQEIDSHTLAYHCNEQSLSDWVRYLAAQQLATSEHKNFQLVCQSIQLEETIDIKAATQERTALIKELEENLPKDQLEKLIVKSLAFRQGKISATEFYSHLEQYLQPESGCLPQTVIGNLTKYIELVKIKNSLNVQELFWELQQLETALYEKHIENEEQKKVWELGYSLVLLTDLCQLAINRLDWSIYQEQILDKEDKLLQDIETIAQQYSIIFPHEAISLSVLPLAKRFYAIARERDYSLTNNLITEIKRNSAVPVVLVAGGFHSEGIVEILKNSDYSYVVITPRISTDRGKETYQNVMTGSHIDIAKIESQFTSALSSVKAGNLLTPIIDSSLAARLAKKLVGTNPILLARMLSSCPEQDAAGLRRLIALAGINLDAVRGTGTVSEEGTVLTAEQIQVLITQLNTARFLDSTTAGFISGQLNQIIADANTNPFQLQLDPDRIPQLEQPKKPRILKAAADMETYAANLSAIISSVLEEYGDIELDEYFLGKAIRYMLEQGMHHGNSLQLIKKPLRIVFDSKYPQLFGNDKADGKLIINHGAIKLFAERAGQLKGMAGPESTMRQTGFTEILLAVGAVGHELCGHEAGEHREDVLTERDVLFTVHLLNEPRRTSRVGDDSFFECLDAIPAEVAAENSLYLRMLRETIETDINGHDVAALNDALMCSGFDAAAQKRMLAIFVESASSCDRVVATAKIVAQAPSVLEEYGNSFLDVIDEQIDTISQGLAGPLTAEYPECLSQLIAFGQVHSWLSAGFSAVAKVDKLGEKLAVLQEQIELQLVDRVVESFQTRQWSDIGKVEQALGQMTKMAVPDDYAVHILLKEFKAVHRNRIGAQSSFTRSIVKMFTLVLKKYSSDSSVPAVARLGESFKSFDSWLYTFETASDGTPLSNRYIDRMDEQVRGQVAELRKYFLLQARTEQVRTARERFRKIEPAIVVPDIHGADDLARPLIEQLTHRSIWDRIRGLWGVHKRLKLLGDYADRGKGANKFLQYMSQVLTKLSGKNGKTPPNDQLSFVTGNHDIMFILCMCLPNENNIHYWMDNGGVQVLLECEVITIEEAEQLETALKELREAIGKLKELKQEKGNLEAQFPAVSTESDAALREAIGALEKNIDEVMQARVVAAEGCMGLYESFGLKLKIRKSEKLAQMFNFMAGNYRHNVFKFYDRDEAGILHIHNGLPCDKEGNITWEEEYTDPETGKKITLRGLEILDKAQELMSVFDAADLPAHAHTLDFLHRINRTITNEKDWWQNLQDGGEQAVNNYLRQLGAAALMTGHICRNNVANLYDKIYGLDTGMATSHSATGLEIGKRGLRIITIQAERDPDSNEIVKQRTNEILSAGPQQIQDELYDREIAALPGAIKTVYDGLRSEVLPDNVIDSPVELPLLSTANAAAHMSAMEWLQIPVTSDNHGYLGVARDSDLDISVQAVDTVGESNVVTAVKNAIKQKVDSSGGTWGAKIEVVSESGMPITFYIDQELSDLQLTAAELKAEVDRVIQEEAISNKVPREIVIGMVNTSRTYWGDDELNSFIAVNQATLQLNKRYGFLNTIGLGHELRHELTGKTGPQAEQVFLVRDIIRFFDLAGNDAMQIIDELIQGNQLTEDFILNAFYTNTEMVLAAILPGFTLPDQAVWFSDTAAVSDLSGAEQGSLIEFVDREIVTPAAVSLGIGEATPYLKNRVAGKARVLRGYIHQYLTEQLNGAVETAVKDAVPELQGTALQTAVAWVAGGQDIREVDRKLTGEQKAVLLPLHADRARLLGIVLETRVPSFMVQTRGPGLRFEETYRLTGWLEKGFDETPAAGLLLAPMISKGLRKKLEEEDSIERRGMRYQDLQCVPAYNAQLSVTKGNGSPQSFSLTSSSTVADWEGFLQSSMSLLLQKIHDSSGRHSRHAQHVWRKVLNNHGQLLSEISIEVADNLPVNSVRYRNKVVFNQTFVNALLFILRQSSGKHKEAVEWILAQRLFHELAGHNHDYTNPEQVIAADKLQAVNDLILLRDVVYYDEELKEAIREVFGMANPFGRPETGIARAVYTPRHAAAQYRKQFNSTYAYFVELNGLVQELDQQLSAVQDEAMDRLLDVDLGYLQRSGKTGGIPGDFVSCEIIQPLSVFIDDNHPFKVEIPAKYNYDLLRQSVSGANVYYKAGHNFTISGFTSQPYYAEEQLWQKIQSRLGAVAVKSVLIPAGACVNTTAGFNNYSCVLVQERVSNDQLLQAKIDDASRGDGDEEQLRGYFNDFIALQKKLHQLGFYDASPQLRKYGYVRGELKIIDFDGLITTGLEEATMRGALSLLGDEAGQIQEVRDAFLGEEGEQSFVTAFNIGQYNQLHQDRQVSRSGLALVDEAGIDEPIPALSPDIIEVAAMFASQQAETAFLQKFTEYQAQILSYHFDLLPFPSTSSGADDQSSINHSL